jgi:hypothetical protein
MPRFALKFLLCGALLCCLLPARAQEQEQAQIPSQEQAQEQEQAQPQPQQKLKMLPGEYRDNTWQSDAERAAEQSLHEAISAIESSQGAYGPDLSEQMLSLGLALQQQQRHLEAVTTFKRGVHLARVNSGLYCPDQIPLLQGQVRSHIALGQYAEADDLQQYLYRVELRALERGEERANALVQQANWQFNAHRLGLGWQGPGRLSNMWELYRQAFNDLLAAEGEESPKLLTPLWGMLRTQYLISEYRGEYQQPMPGTPGNALSQDSYRFYSDRKENYDRGKSILAAIYQIQLGNHGEHSKEALAALVQLGDWALWNDRDEEALQTYRLALAELASEDAAQPVGNGFFAQPTPLPDLDGLRRLPPAVSAEQGDLLVEFDVDSRGRVENLERLDDNADLDDVALRLLRDLRDIRFRPRFQGENPVTTEKLVRAYDIEQ